MNLMLCLWYRHLLQGKQKSIEERQEELHIIALWSVWIMNIQIAGEDSTKTAEQHLTEAEKNVCMKRQIVSVSGDIMRFVQSFAWQENEKGISVQ